MGAVLALLSPNGAMKTLCCWTLIKYRIIHDTREALDHISQT
jgi:hypothetical protein